jgi:hypothetical protein
MTIKENEFCSYYDVIQALIKKHSQFNVNNFVQEMASMLISNTPFKNFDDCALNYGEGSMENRMYSLAIISMSWLFNNMKRKVEDGHCNNTTTTTKTTTTKTTEIETLGFASKAVNSRRSYMMNL